MKMGFGLSLVAQRLPGGGVAPFTPADLFASGEEGGWWDIHPDYLFQNSDGTTAAGVGDPVGYVTDRSGNGNHLVQATSAARPVLRQAGALYYLEFDGIDDFLEVAAVDFTGTDVLSGFFAVQSDEDAGAIICETSNSYFRKQGAILVNRLASGVYNFACSTSTSAGSGFSNTATSVRAAVDTSVLSFEKDLSGATEADKSVFSRVDGTEDVASTIFSGPSPATAFRNDPLYIASRAGTSLFFDGRIYGMVLRGASSTSQEIADTESYMADKSGVTL